MSGLVEDNIHQWLAGIRIGFTENLGCNFDEITVQLALVPIGEDIGELLCIHLDYVFQNCIGLADQLHVAILNSVMHHFDVVSGTVRTHVSTTWLAVDLRRDLAEDGCDNFP